MPNITGFIISIVSVILSISSDRHILYLVPLTVVLRLVSLRNDKVPIAFAPVYFSVNMPAFLFKVLLTNEYSPFVKYSIYPRVSFSSFVMTYALCESIRLTVSSMPSMGDTVPITTTYPHINPTHAPSNLCFFITFGFCLMSIISNFFFSLSVLSVSLLISASSTSLV